MLLKMDAAFTYLLRSLVKQPLQVCDIGHAHIGKQISKHQFLRKTSEIKIFFREFIA